MKLIARCSEIRGWIRRRHASEWIWHRPFYYEKTSIRRFNCDFSYIYDAPLTMAVRKNMYFTTQYLLLCGTNVTNNAITRAKRNCNTKILALLLETYVKRNGFDGLAYMLADIKLYR